MSRDAKVTRLEQVQLFRRCSRRELRRIATITDEVDVPQGKVLCEQGHVGLECFVILQGEATVAVNDEQLNVVGPGETVGEMALLDRGPRAATVIARTPMTVYVINGGEFLALLDEMPSIARAVLRSMSERLRDVEQKLSRRRRRSAAA